MLPDGLATVTVTDVRQHPDGEPVRGTVTLTPEVTAVTSTEHGLIIMGPVSGRWVDGVLWSDDDDAEAPGLTVLAADAEGITPSGWTYRVYERPYDTGGRSYPVLLDTALGSSVQLSDIAPTAPSDGEYVLVAGPQGPPGADGSPGSTYIHTQSAPAATWQIAHGLGRFPNIDLIVAGQVVLADIEHVSVDLAVVSLPVPISGTATCS